MNYRSHSGLAIPRERGHTSQRVVKFIFSIASFAVLCGAASGSETEVIVNRWTTDDGLPQSRIVALAQSREGHLWAGTLNGLARFDGVRFVTFDAVNTPAFKTSEMLALVATQEHGLLVQTRDGLWFRGEGAGFREEPALRGNTWLAEDALGALWLVAAEKLHTLRASGRSTVALPEGVEPGKFAVTLDAQRRLVMQSGGAWWRWRGGWERAEPPAAPPPPPLRSPDGAHVHAHTRDHEGGLWLGTEHGLLRLRPRAFRPAGFEGRDVKAVTFDADGALCAAADGLTRGGAKIPGLPAAGLTALRAARDGTLWLGTDGEGIWRIRDGAAERLAAPGLDGRAARWALDVFEDSRGALWFGSLAGAIRFSDGKFSTLTTADGLADDPALCFSETPDGAVWIGTYGGLSRWEAGKVTAFRRGPGALENANVLSLHTDAAGALWIGARGGVLSRFSGGVFTHFSIAREAGDDAIFDIAQDAAGDFWLATYRGAVRVRRADMDAAAAAKITALPVAVFGRDEGLPSREFTGPASPKIARSGQRLFFATAKGLASLDPADLAPNPHPPPVVIEEQRIEGREATPSGGALHVPPGAAQIEVRFTALSFAAPGKVRFRHRLEPSDAAWTDDGTRRSVTFTRLPPGAYTLRVQAANNDGVWNEAGASLAIVVQPFWWETRTFQAAAAAALAAALTGGVWWLSRRKLRRRLAALERAQAVEHERARIARDLHDDVGARLTQLGIAAEMAGVPRLAGIARDVTRAMDEIVWTVNPRNDSLDRFVDYLCHHADDTLAAAGLRLRWEAPEVIPPLPLAAEVRHHLFLIAKEVLHNAVKHSRAEEVRVAIALTGRHLTLTIADNGRGFDPATLRADGDGLANLPRRAEEIGAHLSLTSAPGEGVKAIISLSVMAPG